MDGVDGINGGSRERARKGFVRESYDGDLRVLDRESFSN